MNYVGTYILDEKGEPKQADTLEWAAWYEQAQRAGTCKIALDLIGPYRVSTIFLAIDHNFWGKGRPILWETMVFDERSRPDQERGSGLDLEMDRYTSKRDALRGHADMCDRVRLAWKLEGDAAIERAHIREPKENR